MADAITNSLRDSINISKCLGFLGVRAFLSKVLLGVCHHDPGGPNFSRLFSFEAARFLQSGVVRIH